eukprot:148664-Pelagomonas_calceolata.AAC.1
MQAHASVARGSDHEEVPHAGLSCPPTVTHRGPTTVTHRGTIITHTEVRAPQSHTEVRAPPQRFVHHRCTTPRCTTPRCTTPTEVRAPPQRFVHPTEVRAPQSHTEIRAPPQSHTEVPSSCQTADSTFKV